MVLALLHEADMHPYEMLRLLRDRRDDRFVPITTGALYHSVGRLSEHGLIAEAGVDRAGNRPERTTYTLTDAGATAMLGWVRRELGHRGRDVDFRVALAEAHNLPAAEVVDLLTARRAALSDEADDIRAGLAGASERRVPALFLVELDRSRHLLDAELAWLDDLLDRMRDGRLPWQLPDRRTPQEGPDE